MHDRPDARISQHQALDPVPAKLAFAPGGEPDLVLGPKKVVGVTGSAVDQPAVLASNHKVVLL